MQNCNYLHNISETCITVELGLNYPQTCPHSLSTGGAGPLLLLPLPLKAMNSSGSSNERHPCSAQKQRHQEYHTIASGNALPSFRIALHYTGSEVALNALLFIVE